MNPVGVAILGCGNRGGGVYGPLLREQGIEISHLVDPRATRLTEVGERLRVPAERRYSHWDDFFGLGRVTDAVVIATPDHLHLEPALKALQLGYHVLLEKPIALHTADLRTLVQAEADSAGRITVAHVLRHTPFFRAITEVVHSGRLGSLIGLQLSENVAYWHYAHSYVRGNWRSSPPAAPFILAKSCHDLDLLRWWAAAPPLRVSSTGSLHHFRPEEAPAQAADRCADCPVIQCPYDARRIYQGRHADSWPVTVLTAGGLSLEEALRAGPYGECVYLGKNNVVDHQAVTVEFPGDVTAQLTVSAFTHNNTRTLKIVGSHGELRAHMELGELEVHNFRNGTCDRWTAAAEGNHAGGDQGLIEAWTGFLRGTGPLPTSLSESVDSHLLAFAAEDSRLSGTSIVP